MPAPDAAELIDLKFLPAWVKEQERNYSDFEGAENNRFAPEQGELERGRRDRRHTTHPRKIPGKKDRQADQRHWKKQSRLHPPADRKVPRATPHPGPAAPLPSIETRFLPRPAAFDNVVEQIKASGAAYSIYALARLFLQKPERYNVRLTAPEQMRMFRLQDTTAVSIDRVSLENCAFNLLKEKYYNIQVNLAEPVKGNFASVARERSSGVLLGPTNHHMYQTQLRRLYEQRFSRRVSFSEFQRQIEIVNDPALVERWKDETRKITTFITANEDPPRTFLSESEAERHFRERYLPVLLTEVSETELDGVSSRTLRDRRIARPIEDAWAAEVRSPSRMMQELAGQFRTAGLHVFRHRKGMLFVSPIRPKPLNETAVSDPVRRIVEAIQASPRITRKDLAEKLLGSSGDQDEKVKLALAADLHWLIQEGHVLEFSDGSLDLPRSRPAALATPLPAPNSGEPVVPPKPDTVQPNAAGTEGDPVDREPHSAQVAAVGVSAPAAPAPAN